MEMTWLSLVRDMGWIAVTIILVLAVMSVAALAVAVNKWRRLKRMTEETRRFATRFSVALEESRLDDAVALSHRYSDSHVAQVLGKALEDVVPLLGEPGRREDAVEIVERTVEREQILLASDLRSGLGTIATIGATAPFLGLLGTVIGITNSFTGMAAAGGGGIEAVAAGIGEALITTAVGLVVAIPSVWLYNYFTTRLEHLFSDLAYAGRELVDWMLRSEIAPLEPTDIRDAESVRAGDQSESGIAAHSEDPAGSPTDESTGPGAPALTAEDR